MVQTAFLIRPGDRQGPGQNEITLATLYDHFWHTGASEMVGGNLLQSFKAIERVKVKAKTKKIQGQKNGNAQNRTKRKILQ